MNIVDRIIELCSANNITGKELGNILGLKKSPLTDWKNNKSKPTIDQLYILCDFFATSSDYLLFGTNNNILKTVSNEDLELVISLHQLSTKQKSIIVGKIYEYEELNKKEASIKSIETSSKILQMPTLEVAEPPATTTLKVYAQKASAGIGQYMIDDVGVVEREFQTNTITQKADHAIIIDGDSMYPTINNGEYVFIKEQQTIDDGEVGIFVYDDNVYCKRLHIDRKNKQLILKSDNTEYKDIIIKNFSDLRTIGKVIL